MSDKFVPVEVPCPSCGETYLQTTEDFDPKAMTNGTMLELTPKYGPDGLNWTCFPYDEWILGDALECPGCGAPMGGLGGMVDAGQETIETYICEVPGCGKACKSEGGLTQHMKLKHGKVE